MTPLVHPGVIVLAYAPVGGSDADADASRRYLEHLWGATERMGMDGPLLDHLPTALPPIPSTDEPVFRVLAGRSRSSGDDIGQSYLFVRHDAIGLCVALASTSEREAWARWAALIAEWDAAVGDVRPPPSLLGESRIFVAHVDAADGDIEGLGDEVDGALRAAGYGAWGPGFVTATGGVLWSWRDASERRVAAVLSRPELEDAVSRWLWWQGEREAAPLVLYLLDAAKLDYETRVHRERRSQMARALRDIDAELDEVLGLHGTAGLAGRATFPGLIDAQERLISAQAASSSVVIELTYLRALRRTVGIARRNLAALVPVADASRIGPPDPMFARDQDQASWLEEQIDQDIGYAEAVLARAREAQSLTLLRLQQVGTRITRAQGRVTLLQTSLLATLVGALGAVNFLRISLEIPDPIRVPLLLAFLALMLAMPVLAAHWFERFSLVDHLVAAILGAAAGWLMVAVALVASGNVVGAPVVLVSAAVGVVLARALTWLHDHGPLPGRSLEGAGRQGRE